MPKKCGLSGECISPNFCYGSDDGTTSRAERLIASASGLYSLEVIEAIGTLPCARSITDGLGDLKTQGNVSVDKRMEASHILAMVNLSIKQKG